ncbi:DUF2254 family protein [Desulfovibrio sp. ZJ369]|uniref:DUF2254 domain-containing protein n=1 Tax=Desulfovibrio sp. ZJ369 TaxID=2709793 RepID=UPI00197DA2C4|nr:DUF2254 family protein [Desulfovibrio sp. ZJ369]
MSISKICTFWSRCTRRLWFYPAVCSVISILAVLFAAFADTFLPRDTAPLVDKDMLQGLLTFIAPTMLTISTFSLSILYATFSFTSSHTSPRATDVLISDGRANEAISAFVAAFIFSLVAIIALGLGYYGATGRLVLLLETVVMLTFVLLAFLRWLRTLSLFGKLDYIVERLENVTSSVMRKHLQRPTLGCRPGPEDTPAGTPLHVQGTGYLQEMDLGALNTLADELDTSLHLLVRSGQRVHPALPVAVLATSSRLTEKQQQIVSRAFTLGQRQNFTLDPSFGLRVLADISQRSLGKNDPGTAMHAVDAVGRILIDNFSEGLAPEVDRSLRYPRLTARPLQTRRFLEDIFPLLTRNAADWPEFTACLREMLAAVAENCPGPLADAARACLRAHAAADAAKTGAAQ